MEKINIAIADDNERMQEMLGNVIKPVSYTHLRAHET